VILIDGGGGLGVRAIFFGDVIFAGDLCCDVSDCFGDSFWYFFANSC
jgi:glyoxylase-like metal-dependent hydrolase (beta-lactamase superfamily II)